MESVEAGCFSGCSRVEAYCDAIFSIVATVMILPIAHTEIGKDEDLKHVLWEMIPDLSAYFISFFVVSSMWGSHIWLFSVLERTDEVIVIINLALMMAITFLPYTFTLMGAYFYEPLAVFIYAGTVLVCFIFMLCFIRHAFKYPAVLKRDVKNDVNKNVRRNLMFITVLVPLVICILSAVFTTVSVYLSNAILLLLLFTPLIKNVAVKCYKNRLATDDTDVLDENEGSSSSTAIGLRPTLSELMKHPVNKERTMCFSDGVFAIVATLIILDICEYNIPSDSDIKKYGTLRKALDQNFPIFLAYMASFVTVGMQWFVHHSLLQYVVEMNRLMVIFNTLSLSCMGVFPLAFKLTSMFRLREYYSNEMIAVHITCAVIFLVGIFQSVVWVIGLFNYRRYISGPARYGGEFHAYMCLKLAVYPILSLFVYFLTFASDGMSVTAFNAMQIGTPLLFFLLYVGFVKLRKRQQRSDLGFN